MIDEGETSVASLEQPVPVVPLMVRGTSAAHQDAIEALNECVNAMNAVNVNFRALRRAKVTLEKAYIAFKQDPGYLVDDPAKLEQELNNIRCLLERAVQSLGRAAAHEVMHAVKHAKRAFGQDLEALQDAEAFLEKAKAHLVAYPGILELHTLTFQQVLASLAQIMFMVKEQIIRKKAEPVKIETSTPQKAPVVVVETLLEPDKKVSPPLNGSSTHIGNSATAIDYLWLLLRRFTYYVLTAFFLLFAYHFWRTYKPGVLGCVINGIVLYDFLLRIHGWLY